MNLRVKKDAPGILLLVAIALVCMSLSSLVVLGGKHPIEASALAVILGLLLRHFELLPQACWPGIAWADKFLGWGIVFMGAGLNLNTLSQQGLPLLSVIMGTMLAGFGLIYFLGRQFELPSMLSLLLAIGTTICGTTAIAIVAPLMKAPEDETAYAVGTVALCGLVAILVYPALGHWVGASDFSFGVFAGTAIHSTPQVVGAGFMYSDLAGQTATAVKLVRNCFIAPVALLIALKYSAGKAHVARAFPWFLFGYFVMAWIGGSGFGELGKFLILLGMVGIGLNADLKALKRVGLKPLVVGFAGSVILAGVSVGMIRLLIHP